MRQALSWSWRISPWLCMVLALGSSAWGEVLRPFVVEGDSIPRPLTDRPGDAARGREVVASRQLGNCLLCHALPMPEERFHGNLAPDLSRVAARLTAGQIRLRIVDESRLNSATIMPSYYRLERLTRVMATYRDTPILTAEQVEDAVTFLLTLR